MKHVTFNHGVVGSNPAGLTNKIKGLVAMFGRPASQKSSWEAHGKQQQKLVDRMAKQMKKAKATKRQLPQTPGFVIKTSPPRSPSQEDFNQARVLLRQRADALVLILAKRYLASAASELTTILDAMDSLAELREDAPL
jgi:hypothetical protein